jgi:peptide/nickel transport system permease protein
MTGDVLVVPAPVAAGGAAWRRWLQLGGLLRFREARIGIGIFCAMVVLVVIGPFIAPYPPEQVGAGLPSSGPSSQHWLGTDNLGRDVLSRLLAGGWSIILVPVVVVAITMVISIVIGLASGYLGAWPDAVVTRILDVVLAIPQFLIILVIVAGFGTSTIVLISAIVLAYFPSSSRVVRGAVQAVAPLEFVQAARARGDSLSWILSREVLPNIMPSLLVEMAMRFNFAIVTAASLSFLGLGIQPPTPNWGVMVSENQGLLFVHPWAALAPALAIAVLAISVHLIADALTQYYGRRELSVGSQS